MPVIGSQMTGQIEALEQKLRNRGELSGDARVQREALENAVQEAERELAILQKQLQEAEERRDAQIRDMDDLNKRVAAAQASALAETEKLAQSNAARTDLERRLRADLDRWLNVRLVLNSLLMLLALT
jgi:chromosome segregation ATPase